MYLGDGGRVYRLAARFPNSHRKHLSKFILDLESTGSSIVEILLKNTDTSILFGYLCWTKYDLETAGLVKYVSTS